jgi:phospholipid/cholesterol/gamma-HCH transport system substrate-binding protein
MKTAGAQKIKTGLFVIAAFGVLVVTIFLIGRQKSLFTDTFSVYANFKNVSGLQTGNFVRFGGINVGTVSDISITNDSTIRVDLLLQTRVKPYIKSDSKASIASDGLMGDKLVQLAAGSDSAKLLKGNEVTGIDPIEIDRVIKKLGIIADNAESITSGLSSIIGKINGGKGSIGALLNSDQFEKSIESTMSSANQTVQSIGKAANGANEDLQAAKHSFLFRGYFKKKEKKRIADSLKAAAADSLANLKGKRKN